MFWLGQISTLPSREPSSFQKIKSDKHFLVLRNSLEKILKSLNYSEELFQFFQSWYL